MPVPILAKRSNGLFGVPESSSPISSEIRRMDGEAPWLENAVTNHEPRRSDEMHETQTKRHELMVRFEVVLTTCCGSGGRGRSECSG